jgi:hypothetical protein
MRLVLSVLMLWSLVFASDKDGCKDHPLITRYPGSEITYCAERSSTTSILS